jgi:hypothetical protein
MSATPTQTAAHAKRATEGRSIASQRVITTSRSAGVNITSVST